MKGFRRIAIADRSALAHNVYQILLKPLGFSLFPYKTIKALRENLNWKWEPGLFLISTNTFSSPLEKYLDWFLKEKRMGAIPKVFLCEEEEEKIWLSLKKLPNSSLLKKPFYPPELMKIVKEFYG